MNSKQFTFHEMEVGTLLRALASHELYLRREARKPKNAGNAAIFAMSLADIQWIRNMLEGRDRHDDGKGEE